jgi:hypothetical protein
MLTRTPLLVAASIVAASIVAAAHVSAQTFVVVGTGQAACYDDRGQIIEPKAGDPFFGQDAQHLSRPHKYVVSSDGLTALDVNTGLTWMRSPDSAGDRNGRIESRRDKRSWAEWNHYAKTLNAERFGGFDDWRLPSVKELYSLIDFTGQTGTRATNAKPYIDTAVFPVAFGDPTLGERYIDAQYISATEYVSTTMRGDATAFGVNFIDGRIKGYPQLEPRSREPMRYFTIFVRGNSAYGVNRFKDNGDGTITDEATELMWSKSDSVTPMNWREALAFAQARNAANHLGHSDWRVPDAKELQGIVDYSRSPATSDSPALSARFDATPIVDSTGRRDFGWYWSSTTHLDGPPDRVGDHAVYVCFGRALGWMEMPPGSGHRELLDVHGAGAQRSDPKVGDASAFPHGFGPQGDVIRVQNMVRLVRNARPLQR